jgi:hypothetical protein
MGGANKIVRASPFYVICKYYPYLFLTKKLKTAGVDKWLPGSKNLFFKKIKKWHCNFSKKSRQFF